MGSLFCCRGQTRKILAGKVTYRAFQGLNPNILMVLAKDVDKSRRCFVKTRPHSGERA